MLGRLRGWKRRNRQETGMEHPKKMKQHSILIGPENAKHICGAYAFRNSSGTSFCSPTRGRALSTLGSHDVSFTLPNWSSRTIQLAAVPTNLVQSFKVLRVSLWEVYHKSRFGKLATRASFARRKMDFRTLSQLEHIITHVQTSSHARNRSHSVHCRRPNLRDGCAYLLKMFLCTIVPDLSLGCYHFSTFCGTFRLSANLPGSCACRAHAPR
jgi:hypothetical protein